MQEKERRSAKQSLQDLKMEIRSSLEYLDYCCGYWEDKKLCLLCEFLEEKY